VRIGAAFRRRLSRLRDERGFMLMEMIVVMAVLGTVLTPVVLSYASGVRAEVDQTRRELAYQNARLALQRIRTDIHCASSGAVEQNQYGGFTLNLAVSPQGNPGWCPAVVPAGDETTGVQWCTIPYPSSTTRWKLFRFLGTNPTDCDGGANSTFLVDYLASTPGIWPQNASATNANSTVDDPTPAVTSWAGNLWPTPATCTSGRLPTVAINFNVAVDPDNYPHEHYQLIDEITLRNSTRCP
jgi:type II secretory pathway pseudopilin PulG